MKFRYSKVLSLSLAVMMVLSVVAVGAAPVGATTTTETATDSAEPTASQGVINLTLKPQEVDMAPGDTQTYDVVIEDADNGIQTFDKVTISVNNPSVANITTADVKRGLEVINISDDNSTVTLESTLLQDPYDPAEEIVVGSFTVNATGENGDTTALRLNDSANVADPDSNLYTIDQTNDAQLSISSGPAIGSDELELRNASIAASDKTIIGNAGLSWLFDIVGNPAQHQTAFNDYAHSQSHIQVLNPDGSPATQGTITQTMTVTMDIGSNQTKTDQPLYIDYSNFADALLEASDVTLKQQGANAELAGAVQSAQVRDDANDVKIEFDASQFDNERITQEITVTFAGNPVSVTNNDELLRHEIILGGGTTTVDSRVIGAGATGISLEDANQNGLNLSNDIDPESLTESLDGTSGVYDIHKGQQITFATGSVGDTVTIYELATETDGDSEIITRGPQVELLGTAPGAATNIDTARLTAGERYLVDFDGTSKSVVLDVDPLEFNAEFSQSEVPADQPINMDLSSQDTSGTGFAAAFYVQGDLLGTKLHEDTGTLDGAGEATVTVNATTDLNGVGVYQAVAIHNESELPAYTGLLTVVEPAGPPPVVGDEEPTDPDGDDRYEDINGDDSFDIFDIQALFSNLQSDVVQNNSKAFNFNDDPNNEVDIFDVQALFSELQDS